jgi:hypothetical protein
MRLRLFFLWLFMLANGVWLLLTTGIWTIGAATVPGEAVTFPQLANNALVYLSHQPTWLPASGVLLSFAIFVAWFFWPGLRPWLSGVDFDDVRQWSLSFDWNGAMAMVPARGGTHISTQACRIINLSATQARIIDVRMDIPLKDGNVFYITSHGFPAPTEEISDRAFAEKFKRTITHLETPLTLAPNGMAEGTFTFLWPELHPVSQEGLMFKIAGAGKSKLTLFEHRSQQHRTIGGGECYDAKEQRRYRGAIGYPRDTWRHRWARFRGEVLKRLSRLGIGTKTRR